MGIALHFGSRKKKQNERLKRIGVTALPNMSNGTAAEKAFEAGLEKVANAFKACGDAGHRPMHDRWRIMGVP